MSSRPRTNMRTRAEEERDQPSMTVSPRERLFGTTWRMILVLLATGFALLPVVFVISSAINPEGTLTTQTLLPSGVENLSDMTVNFRKLMFDAESLEVFPFWNWVVNSAIVSITSTALIVLSTILSAYAFSRFRFYGRKTLLLGVMLLQAFPNLLAMVAIFLILLEIGRLSTAIPQVLPFLSFIDWSFLNMFGLNALGGLILVYVAGSAGLNTWLMKGFLDTIPREIDESAKVDGATAWQTFWMLIFPLARPMIVVIGVIAFIGTFNDFVLARIILRDKENWTVMVGLFSFINVQFNKDWGMFAAGALVAGTPIVILYLLLQDQLARGLTTGAVKG
jgi:arabinogalactan oligomer / maltooligosaccharide transport system permease protein